MQADASPRRHAAPQLMGRMGCTTGVNAGRSDSVLNGTGVGVGAGGAVTACTMSGEDEGSAGWSRGRTGKEGRTASLAGPGSGGGSVEVSDGSTSTGTGGEGSSTGLARGGSGGGAIDWGAGSATKPGGGTGTGGGTGAVSGKSSGSSAARRLGSNGAVRLGGAGRSGSASITTPGGNSGSARTGSTACSRGGAAHDVIRMATTRMDRTLNSPATPIPLRRLYHGGMNVPFIKMHGAGNDFVVFDARTEAPLTDGQVATLADRHRGVGCDQFITLLSPPFGTDADVVIRIQNPDASIAGACGNATRCVAELLFEQNGRPYQVIRTAYGDLPAERLSDGRQRVTMGRPGLEWQEVPMAAPADTLRVPVDGFEPGAACSMGNPHLTLFVPDASIASSVGPGLEHDARFPERVNVGFAEITGRGRMRLVVWERGAGLTLACGSGACAAVVNAVRRGLLDPRVRVAMPGGDLDIEWSDGLVHMTGPAATAFQGVAIL